METANRRWADVVQLARVQSAVDARRLAHEGRKASEGIANRLPIRLLRNRLASLAGRLPRRLKLPGPIAALCDTVCATSDLVAPDVDQSRLVRANLGDAFALVPNTSSDVAVVHLSRVSPFAESHTDLFRSAVRAPDAASVE